MSDETESKSVSRRRLAAEAASKEQQGETPAVQEGKAEAEAAAPVVKEEVKDESPKKEKAPELITVVAPRPFTIIAPRDVPGQVDVTFRKGMNRVPAHLRDHWYLKAMGCEVEE